MPIFRLEEDKLIIAQETNVELERHLENWLENSPMALIQDELVLWIGRQPSAQDEEGTIFPDLLGVDAEGNLVIVELKKKRAPREVIAQVLEYAAWANELSGEDIQNIAERYYSEIESKFKDKTFQAAFSENFETDEIPALNRKVRLFIVAEEIPPRLARVCRFLRTSHMMDISCMDISVFETESKDRLVSIETKVGDEDNISVTQEERPSLRELVRKTIEEITDGDKTVEFTPKQVKGIILEKYPDCRVAAVGFNIRIYTVNQTAFAQIPIGERKYWWVRTGVYRLYDPKKDKLPEDDKQIN